VAEEVECDIGCRVNRISRADDDRMQLLVDTAEFTFCLLAKDDRDERGRGGEEFP
jgi:hypothetical protein